MEEGFRQSIVEGLILASPEPLASRKIADVVEGLTPGKVGQAVAELNNRYMETGSSFRIREIAGGYQFYVVPEFAGYVRELFTRRRKMRLTRASLETLAIIAYRQPVTKAEIEHIRGVASDGVIHNLLQKKLVTIRGRARTVGKPLQYGTTDEFLTFFGLAGLSDLPKMSEIEELISAEQPQGQTQLDLAQGMALGEAARKLNVADGTYDPERREDDEPVSSEPRPEPVAAETSEPAGAEDMPVNGDAGVAEDDSVELDENEGQDRGEAEFDEEPEPGVIVDLDVTH